jgi:spore maturation protein CgeB
MNSYYNQEKFKYIPYPYTNYSVTDFGNYDSLCCWFGSIHGLDHIKAIETISKYPYKFITSQQNTWMHHPYEYNKCTHVNIPTSEKLIEVSKTKASLSFNKLYMNSNSKYNANHENLFHEAFDNWNQGIMPQFKVRTHEIATCKSLILCYKDPWNLIEDFYVEGEEFIYFSSFDELDYLLRDIDSNFEKYKPIIERAFQRVKNYSVEKILEYIKTNDESLITWKNNY